MENQVFYPDQFVTSNALNTDVSNNIANFQSLLLGRGQPGLVGPTSIGYTVSGLSVGLSLPLPFSVMFGNGVLASAHGTINGADTQSYTASFSGVVPAPGGANVTAYLVAVYQQIQQNPVVFIGPPPGHPDYNPNYQPYTAFTQIVDSLNIFATTTAPNNITSFELCRTPLTSGTVTLSTLDTSFQEWSSPTQVLPLNEMAAPGVLQPQFMNNLLVGGTYTLPNAVTYNGNLLAVTCNTPALATITSSLNPIYGYFAHGAGSISNFALAQGGTVEFEAINGSWQIIGGNALGLGVPVITFPITVPQGGTGLTTLPAHTVLLGEGTANIGSVGPGSFGIPLIGQGAADPIFGAVNLNSGAVTNVLQVVNGGTGATGFSAWGTITYNGNTGDLQAVGPGTGGQSLISNGFGILPSFGGVNLAGGPISVTGVLPVSYGGTGDTAYPAWSVIYYNSSGGYFAGIGPVSVGSVLISNGGGSPPGFGAVNLGGAPTSVTGILPIAQGGTANNNYNTWGVIVYDQPANAFVSTGTGINGQVLLATGGYPGYGAVNLGNAPTSVTGTLKIENGGTNTTSFASYGTVTYYPPTDQFVAVSPGSVGQVLTSFGGGASPEYVSPPHGGAYYTPAGSYTFTVPSGVLAITVKVWGAGGGGSGNSGGGPSNQGASAGGGGYSENLFNVTPGQVISLLVGAGGAGVAGGSTGGTGGTSTIAGCTATGGVGGGAGPGVGGTGSGGYYVQSGGMGNDLDGVNVSVFGGNGAGGGGQGGGMNNAGVLYPPSVPGGGGGANNNQVTGQNGADGAILIIW